MKSKILFTTLTMAIVFLFSCNSKKQEKWKPFVIEPLEGTTKFVLDQSQSIKENTESYKRLGGNLKYGDFNKFVLTKAKNTTLTNLDIADFAYTFDILEFRVQERNDSLVKILKPIIKKRIWWIEKQAKWKEPRKHGTALLEAAEADRSAIVYFRGSLLNNNSLSYDKNLHAIDEILMAYENQLYAIMKTLESEGYKNGDLKLKKQFLNNI